MSDEKKLSDLTVKSALLCGGKKKIKSIYFDAFPKSERMPFPLMLIMSCLPSTKFLAFYDGDAPCGLIYMGKLFRRAFIMFFAVDAELRSNGYGGRILEYISMRYPKCNIAISIEPCPKGHPTGDIRVRRRNFYIRNGFADTGYSIKLGGIRQELLSTGSFSRAWFSIFLVVYSCFAIIPQIQKRS